MKDLLQSLGLKQSEVSIERWKGDVLEVARGLSRFFISTVGFPIFHFFQYFTVYVCGASFVCMFLLRVASWFLCQWKDVIKNDIILKMLIQCKSCC